MAIGVVPLVVMEILLVVVVVVVVVMLLLLLIVVVVIIYIIMHVYIAKGAYNACCHYRRKALLKHLAIGSCQVLIFMAASPTL